MLAPKTSEKDNGEHQGDLEDSMTGEDGRSETVLETSEESKGEQPAGWPGEGV